MIFVIRLVLWIIAYTVGIVRLSLGILLLLKKRTPGDLWKIAFLVFFALCIISLSNMETVRQSGLNVTIFSFLAIFSSAGITLTLPNYLVRIANKKRLYKLTSILSISSSLLSVLLMISGIILENQRLQDLAFMITIALMVAAVLYSMALLGNLPKAGLYGKVMAAFVFIMILLMVYFDFFLVHTESFFVLPFMYLGINILMIRVESSEFKEAVEINTPDPEKMKKAGLSSREQEVAALLASGYTYQKIADELFISLQTVKSHATKIYTKVGASNKVELLRKLGG